MSNLNVTLDKIISYTDPTLSKGEVTFVQNQTISHPVLKPSAEELLNKALEYALQGMNDNKYCGYDPYTDGKLFAYEDMAAHLEELIKEAKQNG